MSTPEVITIEPEFLVLKLENNTDQQQVYQRDVAAGFIQFHFGLKGKARFVYNQGAYTLELHDEKSLLMYNPQKDLPIHVELQPQSWMISFLISIQKFHKLFAPEAEHIPFMSGDNLSRKYYSEEGIRPAMAIVLNQIFHFNLNPAVQRMYYKGKAYELLSLYFNRSEDPLAENCPFLLDEENVLKIKRAKEIIISQMVEPPSLNELSEMVGLSMKKLKMGFKQIYGDSVYSFLLDYKLEEARKLLDSGLYNVNEVGLKVGYSTASHFIAAFKKKYGLTPKKYLQGLDNSANSLKQATE